ncbi:hypothetical protein GC173_18110 [bacterium]|nr:hypothetical protein [bacterium]
MKRPVLALAPLLLVANQLRAEEPVPPVTRFMPPETHMAFWVESLDHGSEQALLNPTVKLALDDEFGIGTGNEAISRALSRIPVASVDPLSTVWSVLLPAADVGIRSGIEASTTVFHFTPADVTSTFHGGFAAFSTLYNLYEADGIEIVEWDSVLAAEVREEDRAAAEAFLERALGSVPTEAKRSTAEYSGIKVFHLEYFLENNAPLPGDKESDLGLVEEIPVIVEYAWTPHHLLLAEGRGKPLERALQAYTDNDPKFSLTGSPAYRQASAGLGPKVGDYYFYMNVAHHLREWRDFPSMGRSIRTANALGLRNVGPLLVNLRLDKDAIRAQASLAIPAEPEGLFELMRVAPDNELKALSLVPGDSESFGSLSLDMAVLYRQARAAQQVLQPGQRAATEAVVRAVEGMAGVQLERDLLQGSAGELVTYMRLAGQDSVGNPTFSSGLVLPIKGSSESSRIINGLLDQLSSPDLGLIDLDSTDFQGLRLWETPADTQVTNPGFGFFFAQTGAGFLSTTSGGELRELARRALGDATTPSVLEQDFFNRFRGKLTEDGLRGFHFTRSGAVIEDVARASRRMKGLPSATQLRESIGDTYWTLNYSGQNLLLQFVLEAPDTTTNQ